MPQRQREAREAKHRLERRVRTAGSETNEKATVGRANLVCAPALQRDFP